MNGVDSDRTFQMIRTARAAVLYFAVVFAAGFVLGTLRLLFLVPLVGVRTAELIEIPVMLVICYITASKVIARLKISYSFIVRLAIGLIALAFLVGSELGIVLWLQHQSLGEYIKYRDPVSGVAYIFSLLIFAIFPLMVDRRA